MEKLDTRGISGKYWNGDRFDADCSIPNWALMYFNIKITHFLEKYDFKYENIGAFLLKELFKILHLEVLSEKINQRVFNSQTPIRTNRTDILMRFVQYRLNDEPEQAYGEEYQGISIPETLNRIHGHRIFEHPDYRNLEIHVKFNVESLVESGDISRNGLAYKATGRALITLSNFEAENRRHREQIQHNKFLLLLTFALVAVGAAQAILLWMGQE